ncbi:hypothetical protein [Pseudovibrio ascidiaceicola]|uniref:hypothetical protein n=1 Tax=Pseudovibrio ascidiaceicola TaxID=285279 RepID=UPI000D68A474|nr:hypothetical protein [Pseudovibrio ascidiaceicola]
MFSRKTRKGLLGGVALALAGLMAGEAGAEGGILITQNFCNKFNGPQAFLWGAIQKRVRDIHKYENSYYMTKEGNVLTLAGDKEINEIHDLMIVSHGACGKIGGMTGLEFSLNLNFALIGSNGLGEVLVAACNSASSPTDVDSPSVLRHLQNELTLTGNAKLKGWPGKVALVGGNGNLENAQFTDSASYVDPRFRADGMFSAMTIKSFWEHLPVELEMLTGKKYKASLKEHCEAMISAFELKDRFSLDDEQREAMFEKFMLTVRQTFVPHELDINPRKSFVHLLSLLRSTGDNQITCGGGARLPDGTQVDCP